MKLKPAVLLPFTLVLAGCNGAVSAPASQAVTWTVQPVYPFEEIQPMVAWFGEFHLAELEDMFLRGAADIHERDQVLEGILRTDLADIGAGPGAGLDQAQGLELLHGLPDGHTADAEGLGQLIF